MHETAHAIFAYYLHTHTHTPITRPSRERETVKHTIFDRRFSQSPYSRMYKFKNIWRCLIHPLTPPHPFKLPRSRTSHPLTLLTTPTSLALIATPSPHRSLSAPQCACLHLQSMAVARVRVHNVDRHTAGPVRRVRHCGGGVAFRVPELQEGGEDEDEGGGE